jgi:hypothetical protein
MWGVREGTGWRKLKYPTPAQSVRTLSVFYKAGACAYPSYLYLLHLFSVPSVSVGATGAAMMKMAVSIPELAANVELIFPVFECATL